MLLCGAVSCLVLNARGMTDLRSIHAEEGANINSFESPGQPGGFSKKESKLTEKTRSCKGDICVFCNSKCPVCGSTDIDVRYAPVYELKNDPPNHISVHMTGSGIELMCYDCGKIIGDLETFEVEDILIPLLNALEELLELPVGLELKNVTQPDGMHENKCYLLRREKG